MERLFCREQRKERHSHKATVGLREVQPLYILRERAVRLEETAAGEAAAHKELHSMNGERAKENEHLLGSDRSKGKIKQGTKLGHNF